MRLHVLFRMLASMSANALVHTQTVPKHASIHSAALTPLLKAHIEKMKPRTCATEATIAW